MLREARVWQEGGTRARGELSGTNPGKLLSLRRTKVCRKEPQGQSPSDPTSGFIPDSIVDVLICKRNTSQGCNVE